MKRSTTRSAKSAGHGSNRGSDRGVAVLLIVAVMAVLGPFVATFNYQARVDWQSAVNVRDEVAARNLERGALRLSLLLFELQRRVFNQKQFRDMVGSMDITQVAPYLMSVFGSSDGADMLGDLVGIDAKIFSDLAIEGGSFEVNLEAESGKLNVNCLAEQKATGDAPARRVVEVLEAIMAPTLYNPLFEEEKSDGQRYTRRDIIVAMADYIDGDNKAFDIVKLAAGSRNENYRYQELWDPYEPRNARLDSLEELHLVEGIDDDWMAAFGGYLTVYGGCKINLNFASAEQIAFVLRHAVSSADKWKTEGQEFLLKTMPLANYVVEYRTFSLFKSLKDFKEFVAKPDAYLNPLALLQGEDAGSVNPTNLRIPEGIEVRVSPGTRKDGTRWGGLEEVATVAPERIYRVEIVTEVGAVRKRLTAVYDMQFPRSQSAGKGAWLYYRED